MELSGFIARTAVYLICLAASWYGMSAVNYEKLLRRNHVVQAQILYILIVFALAYLSGSFILSFIYSL